MILKDIGLDMSKIYLEKAVFINRAPFDNLELDFNENEIAVLSAVNGRGKTTILSYIVDAFHEMARPYFQNEFEDRKNKYYRISSTLYNINATKTSFVYLRFRSDESTYDYVDVRGDCNEEEYNTLININDKIPFSEIKNKASRGNKVTSKNFNETKAKELFESNILTYFPAYRFEQPGYLNDPYAVKLNFKKRMPFSGYLNNPIEVISGLPELANWIMDIVLDIRLNDTNIDLYDELSKIISQALISKNYGPLYCGIGLRNLGGRRIHIMKADRKVVYPTIFNLSSGEAALICLFGELLKQADSNQTNIALDKITGIVLIDEVDKHLHIKLQKEVLPALFQLFPNVQFIVSSHSPFLAMGLAEQARERSKIIDLDLNGVSMDATTNGLYIEVYNMMLGENERFKQMYESLKSKIKDGTTPLIITEGKTDVEHIKKAKEKLNIINCDIEFFETDDSFGDSKLKTLLEQISKLPHLRKIIGIFDRDNPAIVSDIERNSVEYKDYGNNVYAFCIPIPSQRESYTNISIEFYYTDNELKIQKDGKCLYFDNEIAWSMQTKDIIVDIDGKPLLRECNNDTEEFNKKIYDKDIGDLKGIHSKTMFAELIKTDDDCVKGINFDNFHLIFERIKVITEVGIKMPSLT